jgi:hypothetical protein
LVPLLKKALRRFSNKPKNEDSVDSENDYQCMMLGNRIITEYNLEPEMNALRKYLSEEWKDHEELINTEAMLDDLPTLFGRYLCVSVLRDISSDKRLIFGEFAADTIIYSKKFMGELPKTIQKDEPNRVVSHEQNYFA